MSRHRTRIVRLVPAPRALELIHWITPSGAKPLGYIARGEDHGRLLRLASGALVIQLASGAIGTLDQRKAQAMIDAEG